MATSLIISVVPASTQAGQATIRALLASNERPSVKAVYRSPSKVPADFATHSQFEAVQGDISSATSLDFSNSDAVFYIPPPTYDGTSSAEFATTNANNIKAALKRAPSVKRLLVFSAIGAQFESGIGILEINHITDTILSNAALEVVVAKSGYFQEIWAEAFETMKADPPLFYSPMTPPEYNLAMVSLLDVGRICARTLLDTDKTLESNPRVLQLHGPREYSTLDVKAALEQISGKKIQLKSIEPKELVAFFSQKVTEQYAKGLAGMTIASLPGGILAPEMEKTDGVVRGETELIESLRQIAAGETEKKASGVF